MADFKDRLRVLREEKQVTQDELAARLGITKSAVSGWERGERHPRFDTLDELADFLDVDINFLNGSSDVRRPYPRMTEEEQDRIMDPGLQRMELTLEEAQLISAYRRLDNYARKLMRVAARMDDSDK